MATDFYPECRTKVQRNVVRIGLMNWVPLFCANCGADGGRVPEENCDFAFYLCNSCGEKWGPLTGTYVEADAVFWERVAHEQIEKYGRILSPDEQVEILKDENSTLSKLAKDKPDFSKIKMS